ncbi:hypothetical protein, partial [uncultured Acetatifactor sp.]|uniref:hypothetical protein n=1 Tax=uncultured Acetatifactor sp. TaxID=1671927 RepID=UPI00262D05A5
SSPERLCRFFGIPSAYLLFAGLWYIVLFGIQKEMEYLAPLMENFVPGNEKRVLLLNPKRVK